MLLCTSVHYSFLLLKHIPLYTKKHMPKFVYPSPDDGYICVVSRMLLCVFFLAFMNKAVRNISIQLLFGQTVLPFLSDQHLGMVM